MPPDELTDTPGAEMPHDNGEEKHRSISIAVVGSVLVLFILLVGYFIFTALPGAEKDLFLIGDKSKTEVIIERFTSEEEFKDYILNSQNQTQYFSAFGLGGVARESVALDSANLGAPTASFAEELSSVERVSGTNVQVMGVDEPDIVKTNGTELFISQDQIFFAEPLIFEDVIIDEPVPATETSILAPDFPQRQIPQVSVLSALPPENIEELSSVDGQGEILLAGNTLITIDYNTLTGYDASNPRNPTEIWEYTLDSNSYVNSTRLLDGKIVLITQTSINQFTPCVMPLLSGTSNLTIACTDIFRPSISVPTDSTFTAVKINPLNGDVENSVSFTGSSGQSVVYVSNDNIFTTFTRFEDLTAFLSDFFQTEARDLVPTSVTSEITRISNLDISEQSKLNEFQIIFSRHLNTLDENERLKLENDLANQMNDYVKDHSRELEKTVITKINVDSFNIVANGEVPGSPLNQFSMDEYQGNLRIATTISGRTFFASTESANDVYVLDQNLGELGSVKDLGLSERIYSVRFIEDKAYVVTFRQIDPFYVINLTNPRQPIAEGELKIPGFSSYLHPINKDLIVGIGQENNQSKISLFDVSNPTNPVETSKYTLSEFYSEVQNTHHAFLLDPVHEIFFMPGGNSGYIFSYSGNNIELTQTVANINARRALFINDYLYVVGNNRLVVLDENTWQEVNSVSF